MPTPTSTVRLSARTYARLRGLAEASGRPMSSVVEEALDRYEVDRFFDNLNAEIEDWKISMEEFKDGTRIFARVQVLIKK